MPAFRQEGFPSKQRESNPTQNMTKRIFVLALAVLFISTLAEAQKSKTPKADNLFKQGKFFNAAEYYKKAYAKQSNKQVKAQAAFKAGECYRMMMNQKMAEDWYQKGIVGNKDPLSLWRYAEALKANGKYPEAIVQFNKYKEEKPEDGARADVAVKECEAAQAWKDKPTRHRIDNLADLNTKYYDFSLNWSPVDNRTVYFASSREEATGNSNDGWYGQKDFDLFTASIDNNGKWSLAKPLPEPINSAASEGVPTFDPKGNTMYFSRTVMIKGKNEVSKIFKSTYNGTSWSEPELLAFNSDDYNCGHPALSKDGSTLYFSSDMPGGMGGKDLWMSKWDGGNSGWGGPQNLGNMVNSMGDEMFPYVHSENERLYYSSNGKPGMGGLDIMYTENSGGAWTEPVNMKSPMNSPADDYGITYDSPTTGYISSGREGGKGSDDLYRFLVPPLNFSVSGRVYDTDTKESLEGATVELFGSDGTSLSVKTGADGLYRYELKPETKYKISGSMTGYLTKFHECSTVGLEESKDFVRDFDFPLKSTARPIELPEIFYDLDKSTLRPESKRELDGLIKTLNEENPTITIKLRSHTDWRATDQYNIGLSQRRAKSVMDYLIKNGVDKERLAWEGLGETEPRTIDFAKPEYEPFKVGDKLTYEYIDALPTQELKDKAHQLNRRTEFSVTSTNYVPKK